MRDEHWLWHLKIVCNLLQCLKCCNLFYFNGDLLLLASHRLLYNSHSSLNLHLMLGCTAYIHNCISMYAKLHVQAKLCHPSVNKVKLDVLHVTLTENQMACVCSKKCTVAFRSCQHYNSCHLSVVVVGYLCKPEDNIYNIDFVRFKIRDLETGTVLFEIAKPPQTGTVSILVLFYFNVCLPRSGSEALKWKHSPCWRLVVINWRWMTISTHTVCIKMLFCLNNVKYLGSVMLSEDDEENREADANAGRFVRYQFTPAFLRLRTVGATWVTHTSLTHT